MCSLARKLQKITCTLSLFAIDQNWLGRYHCSWNKQYKTIVPQNSILLLQLQGNFFRLKYTQNVCRFTAQNLKPVSRRAISWFMYYFSRWATLNSSSIVKKSISIFLFKNYICLFVSQHTHTHKQKLFREGHRAYIQSRSFFFSSITIRRFTYLHSPWRMQQDAGKTLHNNWHGNELRAAQFPTTNLTSGCN